VDEADTESPRPLRRRVAYVRGQWRVTYLCSGEPDPVTDLQCGLIVGPLMPDLDYQYRTTPSQTITNTVQPSLDRTTDWLQEHVIRQKRIFAWKGDRIEESGTSQVERWLGSSSTR
jgi:hypothetical protein